MNLDNELKRALRPQSPDGGFARRVLSRIDETESRRRPTWWRAAAASLTVAALLGGYGAHKVVERRQGERAREQVLQAMQIASEKVRFAQQEVRGIGSHD